MQHEPESSTGPQDPRELVQGHRDIHVGQGHASRNQVKRPACEGELLSSSANESRLDALFAAKLQTAEIRVDADRQHAGPISRFYRRSAATPHIQPALALHRNIRVDLTLIARLPSNFELSEVVLGLVGHEQYEVGRTNFYPRTGPFS
jgi:hypothetical protein